MAYSTPSFTFSTTLDAAIGSPIFSIVCLNVSLSSAFFIVSDVVPINLTFSFLRNPSSKSSIARLSPACPPSVGNKESGLSFFITFLTNSAVKGSIYTSSAISLSVIIVAGFELISTTSTPSSLRARQPCVPA